MSIEWDNIRRSSRSATMPEVGEQEGSGESDVYHGEQWYDTGRVSQNDTRGNTLAVYFQRQCVEEENARKAESKLMIWA